MRWILMTFDKYLIVLELKICVAEFCNTKLNVIAFILSAYEYIWIIYGVPSCR